MQCFGRWALCVIGVLIWQVGAAQSLPGQERSDMTGQALHYYFPPIGKSRPHKMSADVCIYGGTSGGVIAALQLRQLGRSVILLEPGGHLGGMTTGGLSDTDIGNKAAIGGMSREFYRRVGRKYGVEEEWRFEPHIAEQVFQEMVKEAHIPVYFHTFLKSVETKNDQGSPHLVALMTEDGLTVRAKIFMDATYEGDLMAKAGVHFHVGREANSVYQETLNGVQVRNLHQFDRAVDPYVKEGDAASGLLPGINPALTNPEGAGDRRIQAYNFRLCLTTNPQNRLPFLKPAGYDPQQYLLLKRLFTAGWREVFRKFDPIRNDKVDKNNHGAISTDFIGRNYAYPEADYPTRERIFQEHLAWVQGLFWFMANDPDVPEEIRVPMSKYGLCRDEFVETGGWPHQLYVREARRMISDYMMTEHNCKGKAVAEDAVGLAAYTMDSHNCQRFVRDGRVWNEGDVQVGGSPPYPISYRAIIPKQAECANLFVPVCLSASHIAYGSIRMEPVFMILGQSAALAADIALTHHIAVQQVNYAELRPALEKNHQILAWTKPR